MPLILKFEVFKSYSICTHCDY